MRFLNTKVHVFLLLTLILVIFGSISNVYGTIVVKPGKLDHFTINIITEPIAGEYFLVKIEAYDSWGNFITDYTGPGGGFEVKVSGHAKVTPTFIKAQDFSGGAVVKIVDEKAEEVEIAILEERGSIALTTSRVTVRPNKLDHFQISTPPKASAGETFQIRLMAKDAFENQISDFAGAQLKSDFLGQGSASSKAEGPPVFKGGEAVMDFFAEKAGDLKLTVRDLSTNASGQSEMINILPAEADHFSIVTPRAVVAGEKFPVSITVFDRFENVIEDYHRLGEAMLLASDTGQSLKPATLEAGSFEKGKASFQLSYERAEAFKIIVSGKNNGPEGTSELIYVSPAEPHHFVLKTPNTAIAGQPFTVVIESMDRYNNIVTDFNLIGSEIFLSTDGIGEISPAALSPSLFVDGRAEATLVYSKAESFNLMASMKGEIKRERPVRQPSKEEVERQEAEKAKKELEAKLKAQKEREKDMALKAKEAALKAKKEAGEAQTREEALKARQEAVEARQKQQAEEKGKPQAVEEEKVATPKVALATVQKLEGISLVEAEQQAMIYLKLTGPVNYDVTMSSSLAREWIYVKLNPASRDSDRVQSLMTVESSLIGQIKTTEKRDQEIEVAIELLPKNISYTVEESDRSIVIKVNRAQ